MNPDYDYNIAFDLALLEAYRTALRMSAPLLTRAAPDPKPEPEIKRKHRKQPDRTYASAYKGVALHQGCFVGCWTIEGKARIGPHRKRDDQGERWAAQDRARALGLEYLEMRDGECVEYRWKATEEMDDAA